MELQSQNEQIKAHLESGGKLTALEALKMFGCLRLSGRIHDLRHTEKMPIKSVNVKVGNKWVAEYSLEN